MSNDDDSALRRPERPTPNRQAARRDEMRSPVRAAARRSYERAVFLAELLFDILLDVLFLLLSYKWAVFFDRQADGFSELQGWKRWLLLFEEAILEAGPLVTVVAFSVAHVLRAIRDAMRWYADD